MIFCKKCVTQIIFLAEAFIGWKLCIMFLFNREIVVGCYLSSVGAPNQEGKTRIGIIAITRYRGQ